MYFIFIIFCVFVQSLFAGYSDYETQFKANPKKEKEWKEMAKLMDRVVDLLGHPIDEQIKESVIVLNLHGFKTFASCEGHLDWRASYPWIDIEIAGQAKTLFQELLILEEKMLNLHNTDPNRKELEELQIRHQSLTKLEEKQILEQALPVQRILEQFYQTYHPDYGMELIIDTTCKGIVRIYSFGAEWQILRDEDEKKLKFLEYREEMNRFTNFLIEKFLEQDKS